MFFQTSTRIELKFRRPVTQMKYILVSPTSLHATDLLVQPVDQNVELRYLN